MMKTRNCASVLAVSFAFCGAVDAMSPDYTFQLNLRVTEGDPTSAIDFTLTMALMIEEQDGDNIGWDVMSLTIREWDANGTVLNTWYTTEPLVDTPDQLWWIEHANPAAPVNSEFLVPPRIADTAPHVNPTEASLEFDIEGNIYVPPPSGAPFETTGSLDTFLVVAPPECPPCSGCPPCPGCPPVPPCDTEPTPKKDESDEPVEMPDDPSEPFPS